MGAVDRICATGWGGEGSGVELDSDGEGVLDEAVDTDNSGVDCGVVFATGLEDRGKSQTSIHRVQGNT